MLGSFLRKKAGRNIKQSEGNVTDKMAAGNKPGKKKRAVLIPIIIIITLILLFGIFCLVMYLKTGSVFGTGRTDTVKTKDKNSTKDKNKDKNKDEDNGELFVGGNVTTEEITGADAQEYIDAATNFLDEYIALNPECAQLLLASGANDTMTFSAEQEVLAKSIEYSIKEAYSNGDSYYVTAVISNIDFAACVESAQAKIDDSMSAEEASAVILDELKGSTARKDFEIKIFMYREVVINNYEVDGTALKVYITSEFSNALLGGANEYYSNMLDEQYLEIKG